MSLTTLEVRLAAAAVIGGLLLAGLNLKYRYASVDSDKNWRGVL